MYFLNFISDGCIPRGIVDEVLAHWNIPYKHFSVKIKINFQLFFWHVLLVCRYSTKDKKKAEKEERLVGVNFMCNSITKETHTKNKIDYSFH